ncbi:MAG: hypothetical protein QM528_09140 [Phycisphaerales bacterium]|nr:hypothetical protein [Phycisphaerales bacterium]
MKQKTMNLGSTLTRDKIKQIKGAQSKVKNACPADCPSSYNGYPCALKSEANSCDSGLGLCNCDGFTEYICGTVDGCCYDASGPGGICNA